MLLDEGSVYRHPFVGGRVAIHGLKTVESEPGFSAFETIAVSRGSGPARSLNPRLSMMRAAYVGDMTTMPVMSTIRSARSMVRNGGLAAATVGARSEPAAVLSLGDSTQTHLPTA